jgi:hypothetical protein
MPMSEDVTAYHENMEAGHNNRCLQPDALAQTTGLLAHIYLGDSIEEGGRHAEGLDRPKHGETFLSF